MNIHKIIEISSDGTGIFMRYLKFISEQKAWNWAFETHPKLVDEVLKEALAIKVDTSLSRSILTQFRVLPSLVRDLGVLDSLFQDNGQWYPRLLLYEALRLVLVAEAPDLDIRTPAFVIGDNEEARVAVSVLADIGVADFYLVGDSERLMLEKEILLRSQLGIRIQVLPPEELTMQALSAGIAVNSMNLSEQKNLLMDLSYFNFMKQDGYVFDFDLSSHPNLFLDEAEKAGLNVLSPVLVACVFTRLWLERLNKSLNVLLSDKEIRDSWTSFLKQISPSV